MASITLNWTAPGGSNSLSQDVQYKLATSSTWTTFQNVGPTIGTVTITGLNNNLLYNYRVTNVCAVGGSNSSPTAEIINLTCPSVTVTNTYNSVTFSFSHLGGSVSSYTVDLLSADGTSTIATKNITTPSSTVTDTFSSLVSASTTYQVRVTVNAVGASTTYTKVCTASNTTTPSAPTCNAPIGVTAVIS